MSTGFGFGAKTTAPPAFGTGSITFGTPAAQTQPNFGFNAATTTTQPTTGLQFGGTPAATATPSLFGAQPNLNFKPSGFGTPKTQATNLFGSPASTAPTAGTTNFGFGTQQALTTSAPATGISYGTLGAGSGIGGFGAAATAATPSFGAATTTSAALPLGASTTAPLGGGLFGTTTTSAAPSLNLNFGAPASTAPALGLSTSTATSNVGLSFGLGGTTTTSQPLSLPTTTTASNVVGLGGTATTQTKLTTAQKEVPLKEQTLPNEIFQSVEQFKEMVKQQKLHSSDIARCSVRDFRKVEQEIDYLVNLLNDVESQLQKNRHLAEKLKYDTAKCLQNVEMAQRTQDTPSGLQYENTAPLKYFLDLADQFEREMQVLKYQIESADKYVKNNRSPDALTPQDLSLGMRRLHETFVALAGRLQSVHGQVESQKETYLNIRKHLYNDHSNPFEKSSNPKDSAVRSLTNNIYSPPKVATGPTPFSNLVLGNGNPLLLQQSQATNAYPGLSTTSPGFGMGFGTGTQASNTSLFGNPPFGQTPFNTSSNFQLQKPPTGNKRGKQ